jgi:hypothetical protein
MLMVGCSRALFTKRWLHDQVMSCSHQLLVLTAVQVNLHTTGLGILPWTVPRACTAEPSPTTWISALKVDAGSRLIHLDI